MPKVPRGDVPTSSGEGRSESESIASEDALQRFAGSETVDDALAWLTSVLDHVPAMIALWDVNLRNRFANHVYVDWFGNEPAQMVGMHMRDLLGPKVFELNLPYVQRALAGEQQTFQRALIDRHGNTRHTQATYTPYVVGGHVEGFFVLVSDVTQLTQAQAELSERNEELAAAVKAREMLMATLSHDLRSPLGSVIGYTELLSDALADLPGRELNSYLEVINRNSRELMSMVNQLVEFGEIESGTAHITLEPVDVVAAVTSTVASLEPLAQARGLTLSATEPAKPFFIQTDVHALNRVLTNLTANAIKFTDSGSVTLRAVVAEGRGQIQVTDSGPGIALEDQQVIFEAFERGTANNSRRREGVGLGLHICAQLTKLTHGVITVQSEVGHGSIFTVSWPLAQSA